jgi:hypothetical protein
VEIAEAVEQFFADLDLFLSRVAPVLSRSNAISLGTLATGDSAVADTSTMNATAKNASGDAEQNVQRAGRPRSNTAQNQQARDAIREYERQSGRRLTRDEITRAHREFGRHADPGYHDLVDIPKDTFGRCNDRVNYCAAYLLVATGQDADRDRTWPRIDSSY